MPVYESAHTLETPERVRLVLDLAGVGSRGLACLLDSAILVGAWITLVLVFALLTSVLGTFAMVLALGAGFVLQWFYFTAFESIWNGQTPGKRAVGLRVQKLGGYPIGWTDAMIRNFIRAIDFFMLYGVGIVVMLLNDRSQRLGDLAAGTVVVRERARAGAELDRIGYARGKAPEAAAAAPEITSAEYETIHELFARRGTLEPSVHARLQRELASSLRVRLRTRGSLPGEWHRWSELSDAVFLEVLCDALAVPDIGPDTGRDTPASRAGGVFDGPAGTGGAGAPGPHGS